MPRIKKTTIVDNVELQPHIIPEVEIITAIPDEMEPPKKKTTNKKSSQPILDPIIIAETPVDVPKVRKPKFKEIHIKDNYWVENDIYQTIADMTKGNKGAKALIINQALKDYLKKNKIEIVPFKDKDKIKKN